MQQLKAFPHSQMQKIAHRLPLPRKRCQRETDEENNHDCGEKESILPQVRLGGMKLTKQIQQMKHQGESQQPVEQPLVVGQDQRFDEDDEYGYQRKKVRPQGDDKIPAFHADQTAAAPIGVQRAHFFEDHQRKHRMGELALHHAPETMAAGETENPYQQKRTGANSRVKQITGTLDFECLKRSSGKSCRTN